MKTDIMDLRLVAIIALVVLGVAALVIDGQLGEMLMVAVAGAVGVVIGYLFGKAQCPPEQGDEE